MILSVSLSTTRLSSSSSSFMFENSDGISNNCSRIIVLKLNDMSSAFLGITPCQPKTGRQTLKIPLQTPAKPATEIVFSPYDIRHTGSLGFFQLHALRLVHKNGKKVLWEIDEEASVADFAQTTNLEYVVDGGEALVPHLVLAQLVRADLEAVLALARHHLRVQERGHGQAC